MIHYMMHGSILEIYIDDIWCIEWWKNTRKIRGQKDRANGFLCNRLDKNEQQNSQSFPQSITTLTNNFYTSLDLSQTQENYQKFQEKSYKGVGGFLGEKNNVFKMVKWCINVMPWFRGEWEKISALIIWL